MRVSLIMFKLKTITLSKFSAAIQDEDQESPAAIGEGMRDADAGRTITIQKVCKHLHEWIAASSSREAR